MQNQDFFVCRDCHRKFPVSESVKDASRKRGIMERCKPCDRRRKKDHRESEEHGDLQRVKVQDAMRKLRRERRAAGMGWSDSLTAEQLEAKRAQNRKYKREQGWADIGASPEYYAQKFEEQDGKCGICGTDTPVRGKDRVDEYFCLDHDHTDGALRGLLCAACNVGIGGLADDPERFALGILYLVSWGKDIRPALALLDMSQVPGLLWSCTDNTERQDHEGHHHRRNVRPSSRARGRARGMQQAGTGQPGTSQHVTVSG